jgi:hypothetical protein
MYKGEKVRCGDSPHPLSFTFNHPTPCYNMVTCYNMLKCCYFVMYHKAGKEGKGDGMKGKEESTELIK